MAVLAPQTDGQLTITVTQDGVPQDDATVTGMVYSPLGTRVSGLAPVAMTGQGNGQYVLRIEAEWSEVSGRPLEGEYMAEIKAVRGVSQSVQRFRYSVRFADDD